MNLIDVIVLAAVAAILFFSIRWLLRANKNGCSDCNGNCSGHDGGTCSKADRMIADARKAFSK